MKDCDFECAPILLVNFRRPEFTARQIEIIRKVHPAKVFFAADAPREGNSEEQQACRQVRDLVSAIDWPCELKTLFQDSNVGLKLAVSGAIDWLFKNVESGIILEDDNFVSVDFLRFASELLERFKNDERIGAISGDNPYNLQTNHVDSYHFARYLHIWGFATWRRVWRHYELDMASTYSRRKEIAGRGLLTNRARRAFLSGVEAVAERNLPTWDYQFGLMFMAHGYLSVVPKVKLVCNQGVDDKRGINTVGYNFDVHHILRGGKMDFPLVHPGTIVPDDTAMLAEERRMMGILPRGLTWLGCKMPFLVPLLDLPGRILERFAPCLFKL